MTEARRLAQSDAFEVADVVTWFDEGTPEARITALGLMQGNPRLRDFEAALDAIDDSRSAFEQYHGLRLAEMMVPDLTATQRAQLVVVTERALRSYRVRRDSDRRATGERLLASLRGRSGPGRSRSHERTRALLRTRQCRLSREAQAGNTDTSGR